MRSPLNRREFLHLTSSFAASTALPAFAFDDAKPVSPSYDAFEPLRLGEIKPAGWLLRQLRIQADGMSGHLDEYWPDVGPNSGWLGGNGESWERGPYFVDGIYPLAVLLDDEKLKAKAMRFINWTLDHQQPSGQIGPTTNDDWWPRMVMVKVLAQYYDTTQDPLVIHALTEYFHYHLAQSSARPLESWGKFRWQDEALIVLWLHRRTQDPLLLELALTLQEQGFDWVANFENFTDKTATPRSVLDKKINPDKTHAMRTHGVNNGQALKVAPVLYQLHKEYLGRDRYQQQLEMLDTYHGVPNGMFTCDEHLGGLEPTHGTELCTVVETLFSMEVALAAFGDARIADRIEKIAFNALPGTFNDDMTAHQYDQQSNQIQCGLLSRPWTTNGPESNLYGLEPHFGCCTANYHQGWPKFTASLWMRTQDDGLAAALYAPCDVHTQVRGTNVHIAQRTDYPFRNSVHITVTPEKPTNFPISLRIPAWARSAGGPGAMIFVNGKRTEAGFAPGTFALIERTWHPGDTLELRLPMTPTVTRSFHDAITLNRGPLVFSLDPGESWVKLRDHDGPHAPADWQVFPENPWNYALRIDETTAAKIAVEETPIGDRPFSRANPGVRLKLPARQLITWRSEDGFAKPIPAGPQTADTPDETITLIPYGAAKLRVTAFPQLLIPNALNS